MFANMVPGAPRRIRAIAGRKASSNRRPTSARRKMKDKGSGRYHRVIWSPAHTFIQTALGGRRILAAGVRAARRERFVFMLIKDSAASV